MNRRAFVRRAAGLVTGAAAVGCASVAATRVPLTDGALRLRLSDFPGLLRPGGFARIRAEDGTPPIYVLAEEGGEYLALSPICTHQGCTVAVEGPVLVCPCHGSTYSRDGQVLRGPAERPLRRYPSRVAAGVLVIEIGAV